MKRPALIFALLICTVAAALGLSRTAEDRVQSACVYENVADLLPDNSLPACLCAPAGCTFCGSTTNVLTQPGQGIRKLSQRQMCSAVTDSRVLSFRNFHHRNRQFPSGLHSSERYFNSICCLRL